MKIIRETDSGMNGQCGQWDSSKSPEVMVSSLGGGVKLGFFSEGVRNFLFFGIVRPTCDKINVMSAIILLSSPRDAIIDDHEPTMTPVHVQSPPRRLWELLLFLILYRKECQAFLSTTRRSPSPTGACSWNSMNPHPQRHPSLCFLVPIASLLSNGNDACIWKGTCLDEQGRYCPPPSNDDDDDNDATSCYQLCLVDESDLPDTSRFIIDAFGADAIRLSTDMNAVERFLLQPATELINSYSGLVAFAEVLSGLNQRCQKRLQQQQKQLDPTTQQQLLKQAPNWEALSPEEQIAVASESSLVLVLARYKQQQESSNKRANESPSSWQRIEVIASVELRLEVADAKIPFTLPWLDKVERRLGRLVGMGGRSSTSSSGTLLQPYLSTLCVDPQFRGQRIGQALVQCVEGLAQHYWGYQRVYLHVDIDNAAAYQLYQKQGYRDVGKRWNPFWAGQAANIGYYVKKLT